MTKVDDRTESVQAMLARQNARREEANFIYSAHYCDHCSHFKKTHKDDGERLGLCRRRAPTITTEATDNHSETIYRAAWPTVGAVESCGEWVANALKIERQIINAGECAAAEAVKEEKL